MNQSQVLEKEQADQDPESQFNSSTDAEFFRKDPLIVTYTKGVVHYVVDLMRLDIESRLKGRLEPISE